MHCPNAPSCSCVQFIIFSSFRSEISISHFSPFPEEVKRLRESWFFSSSTQMVLQTITRIDETIILFLNILHSMKAKMRQKQKRKNCTWGVVTAGNLPKMGVNHRANQGSSHDCYRYWSHSEAMSMSSTWQCSVNVISFLKTIHQ